MVRFGTSSEGIHYSSLMSTHADWYARLEGWSDAQLAHEAGAGVGNEPAQRLQVPVFVSLRLIRSINDLRSETARSATTIRNLTWALIVLTFVLVVMTGVLIVEGG